jgi:prophage regulatory protein
MTAYGGPPRRMMREDEVLDVVPISRSTLLRLEKAGKFPRATYISPNRRVWFESEVVAWQLSVDERKPNRARGPGRPKKKRDAAIDTADANKSI